MLQGVTSPRELMPLLNITDRRQMKRYIERVHSIWEMRGRSRDLEVQVGKAVTEFERLLRNLWELSNHAETVREKGAVLAAIGRTLEKKNAILGITPERVREMQNAPLVPIEVLKSMKKQEELVEMMRMFAQLIKEDREKYGEGETDCEHDQLEAEDEPYTQ